MSKAAIKKREQRKKWSKEKHLEENAKNAERNRKNRAIEDEDATRERLDKNATRNAKSRQKESAHEKRTRNYLNTERTRKSRKAETKAQTKARNYSNAARMKTKRTVEKESRTEHSYVARASAVDELSPNEDLSEYERLRLMNIQERKNKFKKQFGIDDPLAPKINSKKIANSTKTQNEESDEEYVANVGPSTSRGTSRRKSIAKPINIENLSAPIQDANETFKTEEFAEKLINRVFNRFKLQFYGSVVNLEHGVFAWQFVSLGEDIQHCLSKPAALNFLNGCLDEHNQKHRKSVLGRKTKDAKRKADERKVESEVAYKERIASNKERLENETNEEFNARLDKQLERQAFYRSNETRAQKLKRQTADAEQHAIQRENESPTARRERLKKDKEWHKVNAKDEWTKRVEFRQKNYVPPPYPNEQWKDDEGNFHKPCGYCKDLEWIYPKGRQELHSDIFKDWQKHMKLVHWKEHADPNPHVWRKDIKKSLHQSWYPEDFENGKKKPANQVPSLMDEIKKSMSDKKKKFQVSKNEKVVNLYSEAEQDARKYFFKTALRKLNEALSIEPSNLNVENKIKHINGVCKMMGSMWNEAIEFFNEILANEDSNVDALYRRGQCYHQKKDAKLALVDLRKAHKLEPKRKDISQDIKIIEDSANENQASN